MYNMSMLRHPFSDEEVCACVCVCVWGGGGGETAFLSHSAIVCNKFVVYVCCVTVLVSAEMW